MTSTIVKNATKLPPREGSLKYGVVGGTGMIGTALADALRERGDEVLIITRRTPLSEGEVQWDPTRGVQDIGRLEGLDAIFNLAGAPIATRPWTRARRRVLWQSRVEATEVLIESLSRLDRPPKVYVGVGGLGIFGDQGEEEIPDDAPPGTGFLAELCIAWETSHMSAENLGSRAAVLRMALVLSPLGGVFPLMVRPFRYVGGWMGNGRQYTSWISIRDCVGALIHLAENESCVGYFNGTVPSPIPNRAWCEALGRVMHRPVLTHAPKWALRGALGELADELFLASLRCVPKKLLDTGYCFVDGDVEETFGWLLAELEG